jgi:hypothetical protein
MTNTVNEFDVHGAVHLGNVCFIQVQLDVQCILYFFRR